MATADVDPTEIKRKLQAEIRKRVEARGQPLICELCGGTGWLLGDFVALPTQPVPTSNVVIGGPFLPLVSVTCGICGNTKLLNILRLGITPEPSQPPDRLKKVDDLIRQALGGG